MTKQEIYICDYCDMKYSTQEDCVACEKYHHKISKITRVNYHECYREPYGIEVEFDDGYRMKFSCDNDDLPYLPPKGE